MTWIFQIECQRRLYGTVQYILTTFKLFRILMPEKSQAVQSGPTCNFHHLPLSFPRIVVSLPRRGDVVSPGFHVFDQPRGSDILRLIFQGGHAAWPTLVLLMVTVVVLTEGTLLISGRPYESNNTTLF